MPTVDHLLPLLNFSMVNGTMVTEELKIYLLEMQSQIQGDSQSLSMNHTLSSHDCFWSVNLYVCD